MSSRVLQILRRPAVHPLRPIARNAGGGPTHDYHPKLPPFPPGPRQLEQFKNWFGSLAVFGGTAFGLLCYLSDWKVIVANIPFYNGKFKTEE